MITLRGKLKKEADVSSSGPQDIPSKRISIRDKLLIKEVGFSCTTLLYNQT